MNIYAAIFIIPFTVVLYTSTGGLKVGLPLKLALPYLPSSCSLSADTCFHVTNAVSLHLLCVYASNEAIPCLHVHVIHAVALCECVQLPTCNHQHASMYYKQHSHPPTYTQVGHSLIQVSLLYCWPCLNHCLLFTLRCCTNIQFLCSSTKH